MPSSDWFYVQDRQKVGPVTKEVLRSLFEDGTITGEDLVWTQGMSEWKPAGQVQGRFGAPAAAPPPPAATAGMEPAINMDAPVPTANAAAENAAYDVGEGLGIDRTYAPTTEHEYAHFGLRLGAFIIDSMILFAVSFAIIVAGFGVAAVLVVSAPNSSAITSIATLIIVITYGLLFAIPWLYYARQESSMKMATIGKRAVGIQVLDMDGYPISFLRATGRHFGKILSGMFCAFGYFISLFTAKKQTLHDMLAACVVVKAN